MAGHFAVPFGARDASQALSPAAAGNGPACATFADRFLAQAQEISLVRTYVEDGWGLGMDSSQHVAFAITSDMRRNV